MLDSCLGRDMRAFLGRAGISAVLLFGIVGCSTSDPLGVGGNSDRWNIAVGQSEYDLAVKKWQASALVHYHMVVAQTCECTTEFQRATGVTVRRTGGQSVEQIEEVVGAQTLLPVSDDR